ncbi:MAG: hypothetical protein WB441_06340 [Nocardioidaceae bacterium]
MTGTEQTHPHAEDHCPTCGERLVVVTSDLADTPDEDVTDHQRAELVPGQMVQSLTCQTPGCPGPDSGARI